MRSTVEPSAGFVGRDHQLDQIATALREVPDGRGALLVVSGEAGIGKTRFCLEASREAGEAGLRTVTTRCWVDGGAPPLWPWPAILADLCGDEAVALLAAGGEAGGGPDRFTRFAAVADHLVEAAHHQPVCITIDDVHSADPASLLLLRFVVRNLPRLPIVLLLSRRPREPAEGTQEARLLAEIEGDGTPVALGCFGLSETSRFLAVNGFRPLDRGAATALHQVTAGHPLFLRQIVEGVGTGDADRTLPAGLEVAFRRALGNLTLPTRRILTQAAVLGSDPTVGEVAAVTGETTLAVLEAVGEGVAARLVTGEVTGRLAFTHEIVRSVFEDSLDVAERLDTHHRAALVAAGGEPGAGDAAATPERLARAAHHARRAAPRSAADAERAVAACRAAAGAMIGSFAYEEGGDLLTVAVDLHETAGLGPPPGRLVLEWAQASLLCGHMAEARRRFDLAAARARHEGDPVLAAEAALGLGGVWLNEHRGPVERARVLGMQRSALAAMPEDQEALRCRLVTRVAAEEAFDGGPIDAVLSALDAARATGDPSVLSEGLSLAHHALLTPEHARTRLGLADELIRLASETDQGVLSLMGLLWRAVDLFHLGDDRARRALEDLRERAGALGQQDLLYMVAVMDVMLLLRDGRLARAEEAAWQAHELGDSIGEVDAFGYLSTQLLAIHWIRGTDVDVLDAVESAAASPTLINAEFALQASAAAIAARAGDTDRARAALARLAPDGLAALPRSSTWAAGMAAIVEAAAALDDPETARAAYDLLLPFADLPVIASLGVTCLGSAERSLGVAASVLGRHAVAVDHLERAVAGNLRLGNRPMVALARADLAWALSRAGVPAAPDRARAAEILEEAVADARAMGLDRRADAWQEGVAALRAGREVVRPGSISHEVAGDPGPDPEPRRGRIDRDGERWVVSLDGQRSKVPDLVGMTYVVELVARPGRPVPALTLASGGIDLPPGARQELLDETARRAYAARAHELGEEQANAEAAGDLARAERAREELDALTDEVEAATGLHGRSRQFAGPAERARTAVRKAIKRAVDAIGDDGPAAAQVLRASITTGSTCMYAPDPRDPVEWSVERT